MGRKMGGGGNGGEREEGFAEIALGAGAADGCDSYRGFSIEGRYGETGAYAGWRDTAPVAANTVKDTTQLSHHINTNIPIHSWRYPWSPCKSLARDPTLGVRLIGSENRNFDLPNMMLKKRSC